MSSSLPTPRPDRPNVIVFLTDDQGCWAMGCAGNKEIRTPNLDRLARTGTRLENLFCVSPVCSPARASLLTGQIPSQHGIHDWIRGGNNADDRGSGSPAIRYLQGLTAYTDILAAHGYKCGLSGKWHLGDSVTPQNGFTFWRVHAGGGSNYYNAPMIRDGKRYNEPRYLSDAITDNALEFLRERKSTSPFYLGVNFTAPHSPWDRENHPREIYDEYFNNCAFRSVPNVPMHRWQAATAPFGDEKERRSILAGYFAAVTAMDACVGRVIDYLEAHGLRENTLILFTGDNGMNMGHHGIYGKGNGTMPLNMYDTSVRVPGIISRPGHVPQNRVATELLSHYDIMPTLLEYLGLPHPDGGSLPGASFAPILRGQQMTQRENVVVYDEYGPVRMIRTREWKYVHRYPYGPHELYDLVHDPDENTNLFASAAHAPRLQQLKGELEKWFHRYVDPARDAVREPVAGRGQLDLAGPANEGRPNHATDWSYLVPGKAQADFEVFTDRKPAIGPTKAEPKI